MRTLFIFMGALMLTAFSPAPPYVVPTTMIDVIKHLGLQSGLQIVYDAGDADSWTGDVEEWTDVSGTATHAINGDSSGDTAYNFNFSGVIGRQSSNEFLERDAAGSNLRIPRASWMNALHKDGAALTIVQWARSSDGRGCGTIEFMDLDGVWGGPAYPGVLFGLANGLGGTTLGTIIFDAVRGDGTIAARIETTLSPTFGPWQFSAFSFNEATGAWVAQLNGSEETGTTTYTTPSSSNGTSDAIIRRSTTGEYKQNSFMLWTRALSSAELTALYNATKAKFGL